MNESTTTKDGFPQRLKEAIDILGIKQVEFASKIGTKSQNVNNWLKDQAEPNAQSFIEMMLNFPEINWLYVFRGEEFGTVSVGAVNVKEFLSNSFATKTAMDKMKEDFEQKIALIKDECERIISEKEKEILQKEVDMLKEMNKLLQENRA